MKKEVRSKREEVIKIMKLANKLRNFSIRKEFDEVVVEFWDEITDTYIFIRSDSDYFVMSRVIIQSPRLFFVQWIDKEGNTIEEFMTNKIMLL